GIHLDYIRFQAKDFGNNIQATAVFLENNASYDLKNVLPDDEKWEAFKRNSITLLISQIKTLRDQKYPELVISAAVKPNLNEAKERFGQDWLKWLIDGLIDWAVVMNYLPDVQIFADNLDVIRNKIPEDLLAKIYIGIATYNQSPEDFYTKVMYTSCSNFSNYSVFSYNDLTNQPGYSDRLRQIFSK
ncbi:MAG: family 10 glycosylhydrolase, partial [Candidatus Neomarinimicrobiota bacterium]